MADYDDDDAYTLLSLSKYVSGSMVSISEEIIE
jgi:hypothetical protein